MNASEQVMSTLHKLYGKAGDGFFNKYGGSFFIAFIATICVVCIILYINLKSNLNTVKENWNELKCDPRYAPFAGMVMPEDGKGFFQVGTENANYCFNRVLKEVSDDTLMPYQAMINVFNQLTEKIMNVGNDIRNLSDMMRDKVKDTFEDQYNRIINSIVPIQKMFITIKDIMAKMKGALVTSVYPMLGLYYTLKSAIDGVYNLIVKILIGLASTIIILWIFPFTWGAAASMTAIFILIMVPMVILSSMMGEIFHLSPRGLPRAPKHRRHCFGGDYKIQTARGYVPISRLVPGDRLGKMTITSVMKLDASHETMYDFGNGLYVSGNHKVFNPSLSGFIDVSCDGRFHVSDTFKDPYIYCFNTSDKIIRMNGHLFLDYDELTNDELTKIIRQYKSMADPSPPKQCAQFQRHDIHKTFDGGFDPSTLISLFSGGKDGCSVATKPIISTKVGDILENDNKVEGIVIVDNQNGVYNIELPNGVVLNGVNSNIIYYDAVSEDAVSEDAVSEDEDADARKPQSTTGLIRHPVTDSQRQHPFNIHLLTTKGHFYVYGNSRTGNVKTKVGDYNSCIDFFLD